MNPKVDTFLLNVKKWREELTILRSIVMDSGLGEELKWGAPCYVHEQANVKPVIDMYMLYYLPFQPSSIPFKKSLYPTS